MRKMLSDAKAEEQRARKEAAAARAHEKEMLSLLLKGLAGDGTK